MSGILAGSLRYLRALAKSRRAGVAVIVAVSLVPLLLMAGGAIDFGRLYIAKSRLNYALDQGLLAVGASDPAANLDDVLDNYFLANYPPAKLGTATHTALVINGSDISATATVTVPTVFLKLASINQLSVTVDAQVVRQTTGLEVALVLDNTGSMLGPPTLGGAGEKLADLKISVTTLLDILFQGQATSPDVKVTVVPYAGAVNIGTGAGSTPFVRFPALANEYAFDPTDPANPAWDANWGGCVLARRGGNDVLDSYAPGGVNNGEWEPYFWEAETYFPTGTTNNSFCYNRWWRPAGPGPVFADVPGPALADRPTGRSVPDERFTSAAAAMPPITGTFTDAGGVPLTDPDPDPAEPAGSALLLPAGVTMGPNKACPTPISPLSNVRVDAQNAIDAMQGWLESGTVTPVGAAWGWRALSPSLPFDQGVAYTDPNINKVMIIMTDGQNFIRPPDAFDCEPTNPRYDSSYTGYGYVSEGRLGAISVFSAPGELDNRLTDVCNNIKAAGIEIFTITLGDQAAGPPISTLMANCATSAAHAFNAPSAAQLTTAFQAIGAKLTNLRLAQ